MAITSFEEFEKAFLASVETTEIDCGEIGKLTIREPAAVDFEPIDCRRRELIGRAQIDFDCEADKALLPDETLAKPQEEWPRFSYLKFSAEDRGAWFENCADVICSAVTNGNGELLFKGHEDFVRQWPGGLLSRVADDITAFVRGENEPENPT